MGGYYEPTHTPTQCADCTVYHHDVKPSDGTVNARLWGAAVKLPIQFTPSPGRTKTMAKKSKHRALFNKERVLREATAALAKERNGAARDVLRGYLRGLCDGLHGTQDPETAHAIHVARQLVIATAE